jgi:hypothetical protein
MLKKNLILLNLKRIPALFSFLQKTFLLSFFSISLFAQAPSSAANDSALLKQVEQQMASSADTATPAPVAHIAASANPDISAIGDFQASYLNPATRNFNFYMNEAEFSFQSVVDPYIRADFFLTMDQVPGTSRFEAGIEEAYLTSLSLPAGLQLKAGRFKSALGRINTIHSHAWPTIDFPTAFQNYFGDGLSDEGLSLSWLTPNTAFYQEITGQFTSGNVEGPLFSPSDSNHFMELVHLKNFFAVTQNATLEFGLTGINAPSANGGNAQVAAFDLTYKYKPVSLNTYHQFTWQTEGFFSHNPNAKDTTFEGFDSTRVDTATVNSFGFYSFIEYQMARRWFGTVRYDFSELPNSSAFKENSFSFTAEWLATEFSKIGVEVKYNTFNTRDNSFQAWLRWIFIIGAHGAHQY